MYMPKHTHNSIKFGANFPSPATKEMALTTIDRPEIVFFDVETTRPEHGSVILEFGAILLCPNTLEVLNRYTKFVRPADPTQIHYLSDRKNGITKDAVASAGTFAEIADEVYELLSGRIWAGHNIRCWDGPLIEKAFAEINRLAPAPKGIIDSLELLTPGFARRAGSMKLADLARHFKLGEQTHRSLDDVLMNLEVLKFCATVLFLESSLNIWVSPNDIDLEKDDTLIPPISVTLAPTPFYPGSHKIHVLHKNLPLKLFCEHLMVCFDINGKFVDHAGRPKLNFVVYASKSLCSILEKCDSLAERLSAGSGSNSEWQPVVKRAADFDNSPIVRLNLPFIEDVSIPRLATKIYQKDDSGIKMVMKSTFDATELDPLLKRGNLVDAYFSLDTYDYCQKAGIRLVAEKLIVYSYK